MWVAVSVALAARPAAASAGLRAWRWRTLRCPAVKLANAISAAMASRSEGKQVSGPCSSSLQTTPEMACQSLGASGAVQCASNRLTPAVYCAALRSGPALRQDAQPLRSAAHVIATNSFHLTPAFSAPAELTCRYAGATSIAGNFCYAETLWLRPCRRVTVCRHARGRAGEPRRQLLHGYLGRGS